MKTVTGSLINFSSSAITADISFFLVCPGILSMKSGHSTVSQKYNEGKYEEAVNAGIKYFKDIGNVWKNWDSDHQNLFDLVLDASKKSFRVPNEAFEQAIRLYSRSSSSNINLSDLLCRFFDECCSDLETDINLEDLKRESDLFQKVDVLQLRNDYKQEFRQYVKDCFKVTLKSLMNYNKASNYDSAFSELFRKLFVAFKDFKQDPLLRDMFQGLFPRGEPPLFKNLSEEFDLFMEMYKFTNDVELYDVSVKALSLAQYILRRSSDAGNEKKLNECKLDILQKLGISSCEAVLREDLLSEKSSEEDFVKCLEVAISCDDDRDKFPEDISITEFLGRSSNILRSRDELIASCLMKKKEFMKNTSPRLDKFTTFVEVAERASDPFEIEATFSQYMSVFKNSVPMKIKEYAALKTLLAVSKHYLNIRLDSLKSLVTWLGDDIVSLQKIIYVGSCNNLFSAHIKMKEGIVSFEPKNQQELNPKLSKLNSTLAGLFENVKSTVLSIYSDASESSGATNGKLRHRLTESVSKKAQDEHGDSVDRGSMKSAGKDKSIHELKFDSHRIYCSGIMAKVEKLRDELRIAEEEYKKEMDKREEERKRREKEEEDRRKEINERERKEREAKLDRYTLAHKKIKKVREEIEKELKRGGSFDFDSFFIADTSNGTKRTGRKEDDFAYMEEKFMDIKWKYVDICYENQMAFDKRLQHALSQRGKERKLHREKFKELVGRWKDINYDALHKKQFENLKRRAELRDKEEEFKESIKQISQFKEQFEEACKMIIPKVTASVPLQLPVPANKGETESSFTERSNKDYSEIKPFGFGMGSSSSFGTGAKESRYSRDNTYHAPRRDPEGTRQTQTVSLAFGGAPREEDDKSDRPSQLDGFKFGAQGNNQESNRGGQGHREQGRDRGERRRHGGDKQYTSSSKKAPETFQFGAGKQ